MATTQNPRFTALLVEDAPHLLDVFKDVFEYLGAKVTAVRNADGGLEQLLTQRYDLLMTDVRTPGKIDGVQLATIGKDLHPSMKVIVCSGYVSASKLTLPDGVKFLTKPWSISDLEETTDLFKKGTGEKGFQIYGDADRLTDL